MKKSIVSVIVLMSICLVIAFSLAFVNEATYKTIEENEEFLREQSLTEVIAGGKFGEPMEGLSDIPETVTAVYKEETGKGYAFLLVTSTNFSTDDMGITLGIDNDGKICGVKLTSYYESKDFGKDAYPKTYIGKEVTLEGTELVSGVTYSSKAFKSAVQDAFRVIKSNSLIDLEHHDDSGDEIIMPTPKQLEEVMEGSFNDAMEGLIDGPETVKAVYKEESGKGYAVLLATSSNFSMHDMVILLGIDTEGVICGIKLMSYTESLDFGKEIYPQAYIGKDANLEGIELVSGVTYSSTAFKNAIKDAFTALDANGLITGAKEAQ